MQESGNRVFLNIGGYDEQESHITASFGTQALPSDRCLLAFAERKKGKYSLKTVRSGKWLTFVGADKVDEVWVRVKKAVEEGRLGGKAKVATARPNPRSRTPNRRVICVYAYDYQDIKDVRRVRQELRRLGITERIPYKTDEDTLAGKYRVTGHRGIAKYND